MAITIIKGSQSSEKSRELLLKYGCSEVYRKRNMETDTENETNENWDEESPLATTLSFLNNRTELEHNRHHTNLKVFEKVALRCLDMIEKQQNLKMERELARIRSELDSLRSEINDNVVSKSAKDISDVSKKALAAKNKKAKPATKKSRSGAGK